MSDNLKEELDKIHDRLDKLEERLEESHGEFSQQSGKLMGKDLGILYGIVIALLVIIILQKFKII